MWEEVQVRLPPAELNERRNASIQRYHEREEQKYKETGKIQLAQDNHALKQQMEVDSQKRNFIEKQHQDILAEERNKLASEM